ncbi:hypothetical protein EJ08DRAFT_356162 [Tothia fuscella]|uniref:Uncharacterized protein n=1 Tax=Tothia fuscella TaxID=1048955 RepID=A0A9P4TWQ4_9PEZI|nr:hypothetical protein EJ08DRAFT_356162 [Tothia fuscella]
MQSIYASTQDLCVCLLVRLLIPNPQLSHERFQPPHTQTQDHTPSSTIQGRLILVRAIIAVVVKVSLGANILPATRLTLWTGSTVLVGTRKNGSEGIGITTQSCLNALSVGKARICMVVAKTIPIMHAVEK